MLTEALWDYVRCKKRITYEAAGTMNSVMQPGERQKTDKGHRTPAKFDLVVLPEQNQIKHGDTGFACLILAKYSDFFK